MENAAVNSRTNISFGLHRYPIRRYSGWSKAGATMDNVLCTRVFTTDVEYFDDIATAHAKYFSDIRRVSTGLVVSALTQPELFVGIEADALIE